MNEFAHHAFKHHSSQKVGRVSLAHVQGFIENIRHFSNRAVAHSRNSQYRPIVIHNGARMDISDAAALLCSIQDRVGMRRAAAPASTASSSSEAMPYPEIAACPSGPSERVPEDWAPLAPLDEDSALRFSQAKRGFEEALSELLSSYPPPIPPSPAYLSNYQAYACAPNQQPYAYHHYQRQESHEDDERTLGAARGSSGLRVAFCWEFGDFRCEKEANHIQIAIKCNNIATFGCFCTF